MGVVSVCLPHHRVSPGNRGGFVATGRELQRASQNHTSLFHSTHASTHAESSIPVMLMSSWYYQQAQTAVRALHLFAPGCALAPAKVPGRGQLWMSVEADGVIMGSRSLPALAVPF